MLNLGWRYAALYDRHGQWAGQGWWMALQPTVVCSDSTGRMIYFDLDLARGAYYERVEQDAAA